MKKLFILVAAVLAAVSCDKKVQSGKWKLEGNQLTLTLLFYGIDADGNAVPGDYESMPPFTVKTLTSDKMVLESSSFEEGVKEESPVAIYLKKL